MSDGYFNASMAEAVSLSPEDEPASLQNLEDAVIISILSICLEPRLLSSDGNLSSKNKEPRFSREADAEAERQFIWFRKTIPLVCKRWNNLIRSRKFTWKVYLNPFLEVANEKREHNRSNPPGSHGAHFNNASRSSRTSSNILGSSPPFAPIPAYFPVFSYHPVLGSSPPSANANSYENTTFSTVLSSNVTNCHRNMGSPATPCAALLGSSAAPRFDFDQFSSWVATRAASISLLSLNLVRACPPSPALRSDQLSNILRPFLSTTLPSFSPSLPSALPSSVAAPPATNSLVPSFAVPSVSSTRHWSDSSSQLSFSTPPSSLAHAPHPPPKDFFPCQLELYCGSMSPAAVEAYECLDRVKGLRSLRVFHLPPAFLTSTLSYLSLQTLKQFHFSCDYMAEAPVKIPVLPRSLQALRLERLRLGVTSWPAATLKTTCPLLRDVALLSCYTPPPVLAAVFECPDLRVFKMDGCRIGEQNDWSKIKWPSNSHLEAVEITECSLDRLHPSIGNLKELRILDLSHNPELGANLQAATKGTVARAAAATAAVAINEVTSRENEGPPRHPTRVHLTSPGSLLVVTEREGGGEREGAIGGGGGGGEGGSDPTSHHTSTSNVPRTNNVMSNNNSIDNMGSSLRDGRGVLSGAFSGAGEVRVDGGTMSDIMSGSMTTRSISNTSGISMPNINGINDFANSTLANTPSLLSNATHATLNPTVTTTTSASTVSHPTVSYPTSIHPTATPTATAHQSDFAALFRLSLLSSRSAVVGIPSSSANRSNVGSSSNMGAANSNNASFNSINSSTTTTTTTIHPTTTIQPINDNIISRTNLAITIPPPSSTVFELPPIDMLSHFPFQPFPSAISGSLHLSIPEISTAAAAAAAAARGVEDILPTSLSQLPLLSKVVLVNCGLTMVPRQIMDPPALSYLDLENNKVTTLPAFPSFPTFPTLLPLPPHQYLPNHTPTLHSTPTAIASSSFSSSSFSAASSAVRTTSSFPSASGEDQDEASDFACVSSTSFVNCPNSNNIVIGDNDDSMLTTSDKRGYGRVTATNQIQLDLTTENNNDTLVTAGATPAQRPGGLRYLNLSHNRISSLTSLFQSCPCSLNHLIIDALTLNQLPSNVLKLKAIMQRLTRLEKLEIRGSTYDINSVKILLQIQQLILQTCHNRFDLIVLDHPNKD